MAQVSSEQWGELDGKPVTLWSITSKSGFVRCKVTDYGATLVSMELSDGRGGWDECTYGMSTFAEWRKGSRFFGCTVGRFGNRIGKGQFSIDGQQYALEVNNGPNALHGGTNSYDKRVWNAKLLELPDACGLHFTLLSPDGDNGYPGELAVDSWIMLGAHDELLFKWRARVSGKPTVINLTNHTYWNLAAWRRTGSDALDHRLRLDCDRYVEVDENSTPTGRLPPVLHTVLDFNYPKGRVLRDGIADPLIAPQRGYDHCLVFASAEQGPQPQADQPENGGWAAAVPRRGELSCSSTGYGFHLHTTQPGVQVYTANYIADGLAGFEGDKMRQRGACCLETQNFPDAPNHPSFPSAVLRPGETYEHTTVHRFFRAEVAAM